MQLTGQAVKHAVFGKGVVTGQEGNVVTVTFSQGEKRFLYPDAFQKFLTLIDENASEKVDELLQEQKEQQDAELQAMLVEQERQQKIHNFKVSVNSQAVFALEMENQDALHSWQVTSGTYLSGSAKGEVRIPDKLKPNSVCLLTERQDDQPEQERMIVGAFMVEEDFFGNESPDGLIKAHPKFRLALDQEHRLRYWDYFESKGKPRWGNADFKYCNNRIAQRILYDLWEELRATDDGRLAEDFYSYYCTQNKLQGPPRERID